MDKITHFAFSREKFRSINTVSLRRTPEFNMLFRVHVGIAEEDNKILYKYEAKESVLTGSLAN